MIATTDIPQLAPIYSGPTMSPELEAKLAAKAEQADAERVACEARELRALADSGAVPGSLDDLRAVNKRRDGGTFSRWLDRNAELAQAIAADPSQCCGEWQAEGYHGWCSRLGKPVRFEEIGRDRENRPILNRCDGCPVASAKRRASNESEAWIESFFSFLEALEHGNGPLFAVRT